MTYTKIITAAVFTVAASTAFAKGHDQSQGADGTPGKNAGSETAAAAQTLGAALGGGKGLGGKSPGKSNEANSSGDGPETNE